MYYPCFCVQPLTVLGHLTPNFDKLSLKNCPFTKYITFFQIKILSYIVKSTRNIFHRNLQKATENISAEVFPPKFYPPKFLGFNEYAKKLVFESNTEYSSLTGIHLIMKIFRRRDFLQISPTLQEFKIDFISCVNFISFYLTIKRLLIFGKK